MSVRNIAGGTLAPLPAAASPAPTTPAALNPATSQRVESLRDRLDQIRRQRDSGQAGTQ
jgi:hypothetical protein